MDKSQNEKDLQVKTEPMVESTTPVKIENNDIKQEDTAKTSTETQPPAKSTRASSASAAVTRGGRAFVPNLGVRRSEVKNETKSEQDKDKKARRSITPNLGARGSRGRGARNQANLIQSHSIFEAGPAESTKRFGNERNSAEAYSKVVGLSNSIGNSSSSAGVSSKREPNDDNKHKIEGNLIIEDLKDDESSAFVTLKNENKEFENAPKNVNNDFLTKTELKDKKTLFDLVTPNEEEKSKEKLVLIQLPENFEFQKLGEGHIGKIKVYKSGKIVMSVNNDNYLNVSLSVSGGFLQDAVVVDGNAEISPSQIVNVGHIAHKLICSPKIFF